VSGGEMRDYQLVGLDWLVDSYERHGLCPILGDEMGLGKTLQTIAFLAYLKHELKAEGASLVVCPLSVLSTWTSELARWCPSLRTVKLHSSDPAERERLKDVVLNQIGSYDVVVTTYEMVKSPLLRTALVQKVHWRMLVLDEGHIIKSVETDISATVRKMHFASALLLTGTPLQNNLTELWALLNFLYPDVFTTSDVFDAGFNISDGVADAETMNAAHHVLQLLMLRRLKESVAAEMPPKLETLVTCPLADAQLFWYRRLLLKDSSVLRTVEATGTDSLGDGDAPAPTAKYKTLMNLLMQLRKCCDHPYLFAGAEDDPDETSLEELVGASGKLRVLDRLLLKLIKQKHRVVLFSQFASMVDLLDDYCRLRRFNFLRLTGSTNRVQRMVNLQAFNAPDSKVFIFLMTTRAGGLGINLQTADTAILFDSDWNPQCDLQAMARVHRLGQTKPVHVYRLVSGGTAEERVVQRAQKKLYLSETVNRGADAGEGMSKLSGAEVMAMIQFGAAAVFAGGNREPTDAELDRIIDRTRGKDDGEGALSGGRMSDAASFNASSAPVSTHSLFGRDFVVPKSEKDIAGEWRKLVEGTRERKQRIKMVAGGGSGYGSAYVPVLASNDYSLGEGETSVFSRELGGRAEKGAFADTKRKLVIAGRDYQHEPTCLACVVPPATKGTKAACLPCGPPTLQCKLCPMAFHSACAHEHGCAEAVGALGQISFTCPHHACVVCSRKASAAGGMLFRCEACPKAFCEDCLPKEANIVGCSARLEARGVRLPSQACYVRCSKRCDAFMGQASGSELEPTVEYLPLELEEIGAAEREAAVEREAAAAAASAAAVAAAGADAGEGPSVGDGGALFSKLFGSVLDARRQVDQSMATHFGSCLRALLLELGEWEDGHFYTVPPSGAIKKPFAHRLAARLYEAATAESQREVLPSKAAISERVSQTTELLRRAVSSGELQPYHPGGVPPADVAMTDEGGAGTSISTAIGLDEDAASPAAGAGGGGEGASRGLFVPAAGLERLKKAATREAVYVCSASLAAELHAKIAEEHAAQAAAIRQLAKRVLPGLGRAAWAVEARSGGKMPELSILASRLGPSAWGTAAACPIGVNCAHVDAYVKAGHVCTLFRDDDERELSHFVAAYLFNTGALSVVNKSNEIVTASEWGQLDDGQQLDDDSSQRSWADVKAFTLPRTPKVLQQLEERASAAAAAKSAAAQEKLEKAQARADAEAAAIQIMTERVELARSFNERTALHKDVRARWIASHLGCHVDLLTAWRSPMSSVARGYPPYQLANLDARVRSLLAGNEIESAAAALTALEATGEIGSAYVHAAPSRCLARGLRARMAAKGLSIHEMAMHFRVDTGRMSEWLNATMAPIATTSLDTLARAVLVMPAWPR